MDGGTGQGLFGRGPIGKLYDRCFGKGPTSTRKPPSFSCNYHRTPPSSCAGGKGGSSMVSCTSVPVASFPVLGANQEGSIRARLVLAEHHLARYSVHATSCDGSHSERRLHTLTGRLVTSQEPSASSIPTLSRGRSSAPHGLAYDGQARSDHGANFLPTWKTGPVARRSVTRVVQAVSEVGLYGAMPSAPGKVVSLQRYGGYTL